MRLAGRWLLWMLAALLGLPVLALALLAAFANTQAGRDFIERKTAEATSGEIKLAALAGRFPDELRLGHLELNDQDGTWLTMDGLTLSWSPLRLFHGEAALELVEAEHISVDRLPPPSPPEPEEPSSEFSLPVSVRLGRLRVGRLDLGEAVAGQAMSLSIDGQAKLASLQQGEADLAVKRLDGKGAYTLGASLGADKIKAKLAVQEPPQGLISSFAGIQEPYPLTLDAAVEGQLSALHTQLELNFGPLHVAALGQVDVDHQTIPGLNVQASAPAMQPRPEIAWQAVKLDAQVQGSFKQPHARAKLRVEGLNAADAAIRAIALDVQGDAGRVELKGEAAGIKLPGPKPDLLQASPLNIQADVQLDAAQRPVNFALKHPLLAVEGKAVTAGATRLDLSLSLPDLKPYAAIGGLDTQGKTWLDLKLAQRDDTTQLDLDGTISVTGGKPPLPGLLGNAAKLGLSVALKGQDVNLSKLKLDGKALAVEADGSLASNIAKFNWKLALNDFAAVVAGGFGKLSAQGQIEGSLDKVAVLAEIDGDLGTKELPRSPLKAKIELDGLPTSPVGEITAKGTLGGAPLELQLAAQAPPDGLINVTINRADWKSVHAQGGLSLPKGGELPSGKIELRMGNLADLKPLLNLPLTGTMASTVEAAPQGRPTTKLKLEAHQAGLAGTASVAQANLDLTVGDPLHKLALDGQLKLDGIAAGTLAGGSLGLELAGPLEALKLRLSTRLPNLAGAELRLDTAATVDAQARQVLLAELQAHWKGETLSLFSPARIAFKDGVALDRLRLGLRQAVLEVSGLASPKLDLEASLRDVDVGMAALFAPGPALGGLFNMEAKLGGTPARPTGTVEMSLKDLKLRSGPGRSLPPVNLAASAQLHGASAEIDAKLDAGRELNLGLNGQVPLAATGPLDLRANGSMDLKLLDPVLTAEGRRAHGQITLDAAVAGTLSAPEAKGNLRLADGDVQDYGTGARVNALNALVEAEDGKIRLSKLEGRAGPGTISASGEVDLQGEGTPVDLSLTARNARPLAGDRLSVDLNASLTLRGQAKRNLAAAGAVHIKKAEIRIPEKLPASVAVLKVIRPGEAPPPPAESQSNIALNLTIDAPGQIFVRGRGLDAELSGKVQVRGTADKPQPLGGFALRRGDFSLAGQRLVFDKGEVSFNGGSLADPSLDFVAKTASGGVTAFLNVGGTASKPKITLSSIPELPQDEVLAQLLFGRASTTLSTLELVQIGAAVASLSGATSGAGEPLDKVRSTLGLDRLSVGSSLEAGRYLAPGVYLGAKQGISGAGTQATVQIDIVKGLKVEGAVGTSSGGNTQGGSGANSVGVIYQYEY